jgi:hypothetical protein
MRKLALASTVLFFTVIVSYAKEAPRHSVMSSTSNTINRVGLGFNTRLDTGCRHEILLLI